MCVVDQYYQISTHNTQWLVSRKNHLSLANHVSLTIVRIK